MKLTAYLISFYLLGVALASPIANSDTPEPIKECHIGSGDNPHVDIMRYKESEVC